jgi:hypothetical protein
MSDGMRLAIGGPTRDSVPAAFAVDVAQLYAYTSERGPWSWNVTIGFIASTYIHVGRELFLESAIKQGATHVLWLDTDMSVPRETAVLLAMHDEPIVACNYVVRQPSGLFTAFRDEQRIPTTTESTGLEAVDYCGMGVMLMRTDVVKDVPRPWFRHGINAHGGDIGEDSVLSRAPRSRTDDLYDHDLSKGIKHIGQHTYGSKPKASSQSDEDVVELQPPPGSGFSGTAKLLAIPNAALIAELLKRGYTRVTP